MFIVRRQDMLNARGGAAYLVEASKDYGTKYRMAKIRRADANQFKTKQTAQKYANQFGGAVAVEV